MCNETETRAEQIYFLSTLALLQLGRDEEGKKDPGKRQKNANHHTGIIKQKTSSFDDKMRGSTQGQLQGEDKNGREKNRERKQPALSSLIRQWN